MALLCNSTITSSLGLSYDPRRKNFLLPSYNLLQPTSNSTRFLSLRSARHAALAVKCTFHPSATTAILADVNSELPLESEPSSSSPLENCKSNGSSLTDAAIDIKLPRRSLLVQFTCNDCGERTERTINKLAYERGTVFVQGVSSIIN
ncbi:zim17-type zinc finger protein isoform X2 [Tasmannia lanceolata]|uniref:zim17-type zinc finger protein isoform X2 n=1 Tax=Tasmannia lanceolata TaxID=3420 RepID=UPI0040628781